MLATDHTQLKDHYDILIIGSGYGGAITAARLGYANHKAGGNLSIAILERGIEHPTGSFSSTALEFAGLLKTGFTPLGPAGQNKHAALHLTQKVGHGLKLLGHAGASVFGTE